MKFDASKEVLLSSVQVVENAVDVKTTLPILSNILIEAEEGIVSFIGTDLQMAIISSLPLKPVVTGAITVPAKKFLDIIKSLPEATVSLSLKKNNKVFVECGKIVFTVLGSPKEEFPQIPEFKNKDFIPLQQKTLKQMLHQVTFAASLDETSKYVLNGVLFVVKTSLVRLVATNGRRLAVAQAEMQLPHSRETKAVVPIKAVQELSGILTDEGDVKIFFGENQVLFDVGSSKIASRLLEGEFPNYEKVIPKEAKEKMTVSRATLLDATRRANIYSSKDSIPIKMELSKDRLVLSKSTPYLGDVKEELEVEYKGKEIIVGFNPEYLIDVLKVMDQDRVSLEFTDAETPSVIRVGNAYTYVASLMRIA